MSTVVLLILSNVFMTFAWYGHLRYKSSPIWIAIGASWGIAFFEYCLQVPANRWGHGQFTAAQLKTIQEVITLSVFAVFSVLYLKEEITLKIIAGFAFIAFGAFLIFKD
ncbi:DMT family protein [bacterium]|nr:DMT family protein [bacterium]